MDIANRVRQLRESKGLTKTRLAELSGVSQSFISAIEAGQKKPTVEVLGKICSGLGVSLPDFLIEGYEIDPDAIYLSKLMKHLSEEEKQALIKYVRATLKRKGLDPE